MTSLGAPLGTVPPSVDRQDQSGDWGAKASAVNSCQRLGRRIESNDLAIRRTWPDVIILPWGGDAELAYVVAPAFWGLRPTRLSFIR
jgi:hypothetical protein